MTAKERAYLAKLERKCAELEQKCSDHLRIYRDQATELIELRARLAAIREMTEGVKE